MPEQQPKVTTRSKRGFGQARKRSSGRYAANYTHQGRLWRAPATFPNKDSATAWLHDERKLIDLGTWTPPADRAAKKAATRITFETYAREWLRQKTGITSRTRDLYSSHLENNLLPELGDLALTEITPEVVRSWLAGLGGDRPTRNAHSYALLRTILNTAVDDSLIERNPCRVKGAGRVKHTARSVVLLDAAQLAELAGKMPDDRRLAVLLAGWLGLRKGELFALRRCDIAPDGSLVSIERAVTYRGGRFEVGATKTRESKRTVTVPPHVRPELLAHLERFTAPESDALLFVDPATGSFDGEWRFRVQWDAAREAIGKPGLHFHDLRHFGGVVAAQTGATTREVMARLGHTSSTMAMRYQHVAEGRAATLADRLSELANNADTPQMD